MFVLKQEFLQWTGNNMITQHTCINNMNTHKYKDIIYIYILYNIIIYIYVELCRYVGVYVYMYDYVCMYIEASTGTYSWMSEFNEQFVRNSQENTAMVLSHELPTQLELQFVTQPAEGCHDAARNRC